MKDETDKEMIAEMRPTYERMKTLALAKLEAGSDKKEICQTGNVRVNGRKLTYNLYLNCTSKGIDEQFEYYDYRYFHRKFIPSA